MTDLFEEVEEQLRSDRVKTLAIKALPWVLALVAAILVAVGAVWGWREYQTNAAAKASEQYAQALTAMGAGDKAKATTLWTDVSKSPAKGYKTLALMQLGGLQLADGKTAEGVALIDKAADAAPNDILGDAARLKSALALLDTAPYTEIEGRLKPLLEDDHAYKVQAREALAYAKLMKGDLKGAREDFVVISQTLDAPEAARERAKKAIELVDTGSAAAVAPTARAAAALPAAQSVPAPAPAAAPAQPQASGPQ